MLEKLNNMKVQPKLKVCFLIVVILASISGILGTGLLLKSDSDYSKALVQNGFAQGDIGQFNTYLNKAGALVRDVIFLTDEAEIESVRDEINQLEEQYNQALVQAKEKCQTDGELEYINVIDEKLPQYEQLKEQVIELGIQNLNDEALELFRDEASPVLTEIMSAAEGLGNLNITLGNDVSSKLTTQNRIITCVIIAVIIATILISIGFATYIAKSFSGPIIKVQEASAKLAAGELDIEIAAESEDEIGQMTKSFSDAASMMQKYIEEISRELKEFAKGNFDLTSEVKFLGDFAAIEQAILTISDSLSNTLHQINEASGQVAIGASQMAESAQSLAEGATEQAGAVEELTATIEDVTNSVRESADKAGETYEQAKGYEKEAESSSKEMEELTRAMDRISTTSKEIENIIGEIEDIASQTNLLSLNASIEAARAGEAGKGFAVVADQIGKLASDSAQSAVNTRELIGNAISEIEKGNSITTKTTQAIEKVIDGINMLAQSSKDTSDRSAVQAETMKQIEEGIGQISMVVQSNSAAAQETSATSEELSAQSDSLNELVEKFKLKQV